MNKESLIPDIRVSSIPELINEFSKYCRDNGVFTVKIIPRLNKRRKDILILYEEYPLPITKGYKKVEEYEFTQKVKEFFGTLELRCKDNIIMITFSEEDNIIVYENPDKTHKIEKYQYYIAPGRGGRKPRKNRTKV